MSVDVSQAGEGQLEIMVNRGMVKNSVRSLGKGIFTVSFVPRDARPHLVDISFNGEPIPRQLIHLRFTFQKVLFFVCVEFRVYLSGSTKNT